MRRTGHWWGYEVTGFTPDIVVTGKPMGNGLPLAATAASRALVETFRARTRYFNTFASSPLQAAVGMAVLDEIEQRDLRGNVATVGAALKAALTQRKGASDAIGDVRGHGLFIGVEMVQARGQRARHRARQAGDQPAEGQGLPDQQCRRLRQCGEDPPAADVLAGRRGRIPGRLGRDDRRPRGMTDGGGPGL